jgi:predicted CXXCH cytochrome family protein
MTTRISLLIAILSILGLAACHNGAVTVPGQQTLRYVSADVCAGCHKEIADEWEDTLHADALPNLEASGHASESCFVCHVVSLDGDPANSGFDDPDPTVADRFGGVQCESCHGPGSEHVATLVPLVANVSATLCGSCHTQAHHPTYDEWKLSLHAAALTNVLDNSHFTTECMECHSADYIFAKSVPADAVPSDFEFGITCVVCHDPHSEENDYQLRSDVVDLCYRCHTDEAAVPGESVHHPNGDMYQGIGGYEYPGETYSSSAHTYLAGACVNCHMWTAPFDATGTGEDAISGHEFIPVIQACQECHPDATTFDYDGAQTYIQGLIDELQAKLDAATDADKLTLSYEYALFNLQFVEQDGSLGIHNFDYASKLLTDALENFEPGS